WQASTRVSKLPGSMPRSLLPASSGVEAAASATASTSGRRRGYRRMEDPRSRGSQGKEWRQLAAPVGGGQCQRSCPAARVRRTGGRAGQSVFENTPSSRVPKAASRHQKALALSTGMGTNTASTARAASSRETISTGQVGGVSTGQVLGWEGGPHLPTAARAAPLRRRIAIVAATAERL